MKILIYAAGAVGLGIGSCLIKAGADVSIVARKETVRWLKKEGLIRDGIFGEYRAKPNSFRAFSSLKELSSRYRYILVCCKSFDTRQCAKDLSEKKDILEDNSAIVLFQNGWGNAEIFSDFFEKDLIYNARVITGFERKKPNHVSITVHADSIHIGSLFGGDLSKIEPLCKLISAGGIPCSVSSSIEKDLWAKMLYNCLLNPLSAILKVPYGRLAQDSNTKSIMNNIAREIFLVMKAAGYKTYWESAEQYLEVFYRELIPKTADHRSSMLQDIEKGKRTEIESLNGAVIRIAEKKGISVPYNTAVYSMVKFLEEGVSPQKEEIPS